MTTTTPTSNKETDAELAAVATIAAAFFSSRAPHNALNVSDVGPVVLAIRVALAAPANHTAVEAPAEDLKPAVPVRKSITEDFIICLEDGKKFKSLKRHLRTHYNLTPEDYRARWGLPADYPMVAPSYSATRSKLAKDNGLGTKGVTH